MSKAIIECVPNFSEGVDRERVLAIVRAMQVPGVSLLDWSQDPDHNRSVVTIAGPPAAVVEAAVLAAGKAADTSARPPVLLQGAHSDETKSMRN